MGNNYAVIGLQWGDEGKGKIVDILSEKIKLTVRYQGGHNAGHTVIIADKKIVLHLIPSGIIHSDTRCIIGNGVVVDPHAFLKEINELNQLGINTEGRLFLSKDAHMILPFHSQIDTIIEEEIRGDQKIGTTKRGIGPSYEDKAGRIGIKLSSLYNPEYLKKELKYLVNIKNLFLKGIDKEPLNSSKIYEELMSIRKELLKYISDTFLIIQKAKEKGETILFEGAQGVLLDIDYGTYPYVSSSHPTAGGIFTGSGIGPDVDINVIGIVKAYTTRVGKGPFPTEATGKDEKTLRERGKEYGATTGRPRRCGWLDLFALKYSVKLNGVNSIVLTKIDILDSFEKIKVCTGYKYKGKILENFPTESWILEEVEPIYDEIEGWKGITSGITEYNKLPEKAKKYIKYIENYLNVPVSIISTGPNRKETIIIKEF